MENAQQIAAEREDFFRAVQLFQPGSKHHAVWWPGVFYLNECGLMHLISENMDHREDPAAAADLCRRLPV